jgi:hypothetical protein
MSVRNRPEEKKIRALRRALRKGRLPARIDLIAWLKDRRYAQTTGAARQLLIDGKVKSESHPLGVQIVDVEDRDGKLKKIRVLDPLVPASLRGSIHVEP